MRSRMAQPASTPSDFVPPHTGAPPTRLPRRPTPARGPTRPRFTGLDILNAVLFPALFLSVCVAARVPLSAWGTGAAMLVVAALYVAGWRTAGRACGVCAAALLATSVPFARGMASSPPALSLSVLGTAIYFALWACTGRGGRLILGVAALALSGGLLAGTAWGHAAWPSFHASAASARWLLSPGAVFGTWLLLPLLAELGEGTKRGRWTPLLVWFLLALLTTTTVRWGNPSVPLLLVPVATLLTAGGFARLLPVLAGDIPALRYILAGTAVAGLALMRAFLPWG